MIDDWWSLMMPMRFFLNVFFWMIGDVLVLAVSFLKVWTAELGFFLSKTSKTKACRKRGHAPGNQHSHLTIRNFEHNPCTLTERLTWTLKNINKVSSKNQKCMAWYVFLIQWQSIFSLYTLCIYTCPSHKNKTVKASKLWKQTTAANTESRRSCCWTKRRLP